MPSSAYAFDEDDKFINHAEFKLLTVVVTVHERRSIYNSYLCFSRFKLFFSLRSFFLNLCRLYLSMLT